eukprot:GHUV01056012.1.p1 GENE.GHUV01056012.1~~GHUV01056012.1.p1  ORF type:complete len:124 (-),score=26.49 GHUV01056012.1:150-521(-)
MSPDQGSMLPVVRKCKCVLPCLRLRLHGSLVQQLQGVSRCRQTIHSCCSNNPHEFRNCAQRSTYYDILPCCCCTWQDGTDDKTFHSLFKPIMAKVMEVFQPGAIVMQCGEQPDLLGSCKQAVL